MKIKCGNANPNGNISLHFKGACHKYLEIEEAYRCVGCGGWFHKDCILEHFKLEQEHDVGRNNLKQELREKIHSAYHQGLSEKEILNLIK